MHVFSLSLDLIYLEIIEVPDKPSKIHGNDQTRDENHENWHSEHAIRC